MRGRMLLPLLAVFAAGCRELLGPESNGLTHPVLAATGELPPCNPTIRFTDCLDPPSSTGWPYFGVPDDELYEAPNDPNPTTVGLWLGAAISPTVCFLEWNRNAVDADADWLDENCEFHLARAFAPTLLFHPNDGCPDGEPHWAVKRFMSGLVRIAYMPAYYRDCGDFSAHPGDSEFLVATVAYSDNTQHWVLKSIWLSSHYGVPGEWDGSRAIYAGLDECPPGDDFCFQAHFSKRPRTHPWVWVAEDKHANYGSEGDCDGDPFWQAFGTGIGDWSDKCSTSGATKIRFPIRSHRNAGSRFVDRIGLVLSEDDPVLRAAGHRESFYQAPGRAFGGWQGGTATAMSYYSLLTSSKFEFFGSDGGPGPTPPDYSFSVTLNGPVTVLAGRATTWSTTIMNGVAPFAHQWFVNEVPLGTGSTLTTALRSAGEYMTVSVIVRGANGESRRLVKRVYVVASDGGF